MLDQQQIASRLRSALGGQPEGLPSDPVIRHGTRRSDYAPSLAYGRHRGPARPWSRVAAITVALVPDDDHGWVIPLTRRPLFLKHHPGQISFPGGRVEGGESILQAGLREFEEELGVVPLVREVSGELSTQFVYASNNRAHPIVVMLENRSPTYVPDPREVDEVIVIPLATLLNHDTPPKSQRIEKPVLREKLAVGQVVLSTPVLKLSEHTIWGATAMMLDELAQILRPLHQPSP
ncbi:MAG: CoA pyrophosphatase [Planctomycetota bacterium]